MIIGCNRFAGEKTALIFRASILSKVPKSCNKIELTIKHIMLDIIIGSKNIFNELLFLYKTFVIIQIIKVSNTIVINVAKN